MKQTFLLILLGTTVSDKLKYGRLLPDYLITCTCLIITHKLIIK